MFVQVPRMFSFQEQCRSRPSGRGLGGIVWKVTYVRDCFGEDIKRDAKDEMGVWTGGGAGVG